MSATGNYNRVRAEKEAQRRGCLGTLAMNRSVDIEYM